MKKILVIFIVILFLITFWIGSIIKCEIITSQHAKEFLCFKEVNTASKFKILTYTNDFARIYCVNFNNTNGSVHNFIKQDNTWIYNEWEDGGWSQTGNADGFIWPYIR
ncbi:MAG: hypothetical protein IJF61_03720 [Clostridia bacterium]|nr:hypothetical protein [Clostridia bacterium]